MRNLFSTLTAITLAALIVSGAQAASKVWQAKAGVMGGSWNDTGHWVGGVIPVPGSDDVQFPTNSVSANTQYTVTVNVANAEVNFMDMHTDCLLDVGANTFKLGTADGQTSNIAGMIRLNSASSILQFNFSHTLAPKTISAVPVYGSVKGLFDAAQDQIAATKTLTNQITFQGAMQIVPISGSATFSNGSTGIIDANYNDGAGNETLLVNPAALSDSSGAIYRVTASGAVLRFDSGSTGLAGDFKSLAVNGTLDIHANITTAGGLCFTAGTISVASGFTFSATGAPLNCP